MRVVFSGHEHFHERIKPQKGVYYFISGGSARLRRGNIGPTQLTARGFDSDNSFMLVEISGDTLCFETLTRTGALVEAGEIARVDATEPHIDEPPEPVRPDPSRRPRPGRASPRLGRRLVTFGGFGTWRAQRAASAEGARSAAQPRGDGS